MTVNGPSAVRCLWGNCLSAYLVLAVHLSQSTLAQAQMPLPRQNFPQLQDHFAALDPPLWLLACRPPIQVDPAYGTGAYIPSRGTGATLPGETLDATLSLKELAA